MAPTSAHALAYPISKYTKLFLPNDHGYNVIPLIMSGTTVFKSVSKEKSPEDIEVWVTRGSSHKPPTKNYVKRDWQGMVKAGFQVEKDLGCKRLNPLVFSCKRFYRDGRVQVGFWNELKDVVNLEITGKNIKSHQLASWSNEVVLNPTRFRR